MTDAQVLRPYAGGLFPLPGAHCIGGNEVPKFRFGAAFGPPAPGHSSAFPGV
jgi:hypothetical protein